MDESVKIWEPKSRVVHTHKKEKKWSIRRFLDQNIEIVYRALIIVLALSIPVSCLVVKKNVKADLESEFQMKLSAERIRVEQETLSRVKDQYGINDANLERETMEKEARIIAQMLYPMRKNRDVGLQLACWCVFNRKDNVIYPDNIYSVCSADQAFMGWSDSNPALEDLYNIALKEVQRWHSGIRPMDTGYVYLYWTPNEIYLFDDAGHKFYESDWVKYLDGGK